VTIFPTEGSKSSSGPITNRRCEQVSKSWEFQEARSAPYLRYNCRYILSMNHLCVFIFCILYIVVYADESSNVEAEKFSNYKFDNNWPTSINLVNSTV
jgi:hypothetical protein